jgi:integrase/recombinase XerD
LRGIQSIYERYQKEYFPKLLEEDPTVPPEDKRKIADLLKKRWNLHNRRHTATTEISKTLKDPVLVKQYMGWTQKSNTILKYQHYFNDDAMDAMLELDGLPVVAGSKSSSKRSLLKPKICPNCDESNRSDSKFCVKCKFVLSFDLYNEAIDQKAKTANEAQEIKKTLAAFESRQKQFEESILKNLDQNQKWMLKLLEPHLEQIKDEKERSNKERISFLMQVPRMMREMDGEEEEEEEF